MQELDPELERQIDESLEPWTSDRLETLFSERCRDNRDRGQYGQPAEPGGTGRSDRSPGVRAFGDAAA